MTVNLDQDDTSSPKVTVRLPEQLYRWIERLIEDGHYPNITETLRDAALRIQNDPELLYSIRRPWRGHETYKRPTARIRRKQLEEINELVEEDWARDVAEVLRTGAGVLADELLPDVELGIVERSSGPPAAFQPDVRRVGPFCPECDEGTLAYDRDSGVIGCSDCGRRWRG